MVTSFVTAIERCLDLANKRRHDLANKQTNVFRRSEKDALEQVQQRIEPSVAIENKSGLWNRCVRLANNLDCSLALKVYPNYCQFYFSFWKVEYLE